MMLLMVVFALTITGCKPEGFFGTPKKKGETLKVVESPKEIAQKAAVKQYGADKPYSYHWVDKTKEGCTIYCQATVVPEKKGALPDS